MKPLMLTASAIVATFLVVPVLGQDGFADVKIKATHVAGKVYMLEGHGGNIGVSVGEDGLLIVDDQYAPLADKIKVALGKLGKGKLKFVLNTHWHGDHTGGNPTFGRLAPIIAHTNVRKRLSTTQTLFGRIKEPLPKVGLPVITFDDSLSIHFNGEEIAVTHYPHSHTDGDSIVMFPGSNVLHMSDMFFSGMFPFVDLEHGGDVVGLANNVQAIIKQLPADIKIIPGHGPLSTLDDLKAYHSMLVETTQIVRSRMARGKTLHQIKAEGLPSKFEPIGHGFIKTDRWLETIYNSLSRKTGR